MQAKKVPASSLDELLEEFESLSVEERGRQIADANAYLRARCVRSLSDFDKMMLSK
jgi:hypothetical protein